MADKQCTTALIALLSMPELPGNPLKAVVDSAPLAAVLKAVMHFLPSATPILRIHALRPEAITSEGGL